MRYRELLLEENVRLDILHQIVNPDLLALRALFQQHDRDIRLVGGAVRDILNGKTPKDIDLCTDATPDEQIAIYEAAKFAHDRFEFSTYGKYIKTGFAHGTVTVICAKGFAGYGSGPYEITSLRTESEHDGRRAKVAFTHDWVEDLSRRDLTINAMALTFDGELMDPFGGQHDLQRGIIKFVGRAADRAEEDFLRILRYFRFHGEHDADGFYDPETEDAIKEKAAGLDRISGERIWSEMKRIFVGPRGPEEFRKMCQLGVAKHIGLPAHNVTALRKAHATSKNPVTLLAAILADQDEVTQVAERWKLANNEVDLLRFLVEHKADDYDLDGLKDLVIAGTAAPWVAELALLNGKPGEAQAIAHWQMPAFPVTGTDLMAAGLRPGRELGDLLRTLKQKWVKSRFEMSKDDLLKGVSPNLP